MEVKKEPGDMTDMKNRIFDLVSLHPKGLAIDVIQKELTGLSTDQLVIALNSLTQEGKFDLLKAKNKISYRAKKSESTMLSKACTDNEEKLIFQIIEEAGNKGIWMRDLRYKCNLTPAIVNKILRSLETRKIIKAVKSVSASKKKVYMVYNLEPDHSVTGGAWYSDQEFEVEFVDILNQQCHRFLQEKLKIAKEKTSDPVSCRNASYSSSKDVWTFISELGISKVELSVHDIEKILDTLVYDGKIEKCIVGSNVTVDNQISYLYRKIESVVKTPGLMRMPCGYCQVINDCHEGGDISPSKCPYMKKWLEF